MMTEERQKLEFQVIYSVHLERMMYILLGRLDRFSSFTQVLLGVAVVSNLAPVVTG
ncbi:hypothetical protein AAKU58_004351 [Oxalobacteraceae bacterium GrIS 1.18]